MRLCVFKGKEVLRLPNPTEKFRQQFKLVNVFLISTFLVSNGSTLGPATNQVVSSLVLVNRLENHVPNHNNFPTGNTRTGVY